MSFALFCHFKRTIHHHQPLKYSFLFGVARHCTAYTSVSATVCNKSLLAPTTRRRRSVGQVGLIGHCGFMQVQCVSTSTAACRVVTVAGCMLCKAVVFVAGVELQEQHGDFDSVAGSYVPRE